MRNSTSITTSGAAAPGHAVIGPFPPGSRLRQISVGSVPGASSTQLVSIRVHRAAPGLTGAEIAAGTSLFSDTTTMGVAANVVPAITFLVAPFSPTSLEVFTFLFDEMLHDSNFGTFLSISFVDSIQAATLVITVAAELPSVETWDSFPAPSTPLGKATPSKSPSAKTERSAHVSKRLATELPQQSATGSPPQPTPSFRK